MGEDGRREPFPPAITGCVCSQVSSGGWDAFPGVVFEILLFQEQEKAESLDNMSFTHRDCLALGS